MKKVFGFFRCLFCIKRRCRTRFRIGRDIYGGCGVGFIEGTCPKDPDY